MKNQEQGKVLTSDEINYLIYRYLQECGFHHTAFTFAHESHMASVDIKPNLVPPAALVTFIQKGLQYMEAEANIDPDAAEIAKEFSMLLPVDLLTKDIDELRDLAAEQRDKQQQQIQGFTTKQQRGGQQPQQASQQQKVKRTGAKRERQQQQQQKAAAADDEQPQQQQQQPARQRQIQRQKQQQLKQEQQDQDQQQQRQPPARGKQQQQQNSAAAAAADKEAAADGAVPMDEDAPAAAAGPGADSIGVEVVAAEEYEGSNADAFICQWSPTDTLVVTGSSGDPHARIYDFSPGANHGQPHILTLPESERKENKDVTAAEWSPAGSALAAGSFNGFIRVWSKDGSLQRVIKVHGGPVFTLRWSKRGDLVITGSADTGTKVLDANTWTVKQTFTPHEGATLDADWRDDTTFATCSNDGSIAVCKLGSDKALKQWPRAADSTAECIMVRWDATGELLASLSDDGTARLWRLSSDAPVATFAHSCEVFSMKWSPQPGSDGQGQLLVTSSADNTIRLWDVQAGREVRRMECPGEAAYCFCFSPDGKYLAGGCLDGSVHIFNTADGQLVASHTTQGNLLDIAWCRAADKLAYTTNEKKIGVLHLKRS